MSPIAVLIIAGLLLLAGGFGLAWRYLSVRRNRMGQARRGVLFQMKPSLELKLSPAEQKRKTVAILEQFVTYVDGWQERLQETEPSYSFEVHATGHNGYGLYLWVPPEDAKLMANTLGAKYELPYKVDEGEEPMSRLAGLLANDQGYSRNPHFYTGEYRLAAPYHFPIRDWDSGKDADDPMEAIYGIFDAFKGEKNVAGFIVTLKPANKDWRTPGIEFMKKAETGIAAASGPVDRLRSIGEPDPVPKKQSLDTFQKDELNAVLAKVKGNAFEVVIRIYSTDWEVYKLLRGTLERRFRSEHNSIKLVSYPVSLRDMAARWFDRSDMVLSLEEIASIFHLPDSRTRGERMQRGASRSALPPEGLPTIAEGSRTDIFALLDRIGVSGNVGSNNYSSRPPLGDRGGTALPPSGGPVAGALPSA